jgi:hypothetical protein
MIKHENIFTIHKIHSKHNISTATVAQYFCANNFHDSATIPLISTRFYGFFNHQSFFDFLNNSKTIYIFWKRVFLKAQLGIYQ